MKKAALFSALATLSLATFATEPVGQLRDVQGSVTVTSASGVVTGANGTPLTATSRVLVGNGAKATVMLTEGCVIPLKANQYIALNPKLTCTQLVAAARQLAAPYRVAQFEPPSFAFTSTGIGGLAVGGVVVGFVALNEIQSNDLSGQ